MKVVDFFCRKIVFQDAPHKIDQPFDHILLSLWPQLQVAGTYEDKGKYNNTTKQSHDHHSTIEPDWTDLEHQGFFFQNSSPLFLQDPSKYFGK